MTVGGKGLQRSDPARIAHRVGAYFEPTIGQALTIEPSGHADLRSFWPTPFDQGKSETCGPHSAITCAVCTLSAAGEPLGWTPSPLELASCVYADVRASALPPGAQTMPVLVDTGTRLEDIEDAIRRWGLTPIGPFVRGRFSDVPEGCTSSARPFPEAQLAGLQTAIQFTGAYAIGINTNAPRIIAASLDAGIAVQCAGPVGPLYEDESTDPAVAIGADPNAVDGHGTAILSYRPIGLKARSAFPWEYFSQTSWGPFGERGGRWVTGEWILSQWSLWPYAIVRASSVGVA